MGLLSRIFNSAESGKDASVAERLRATRERLGTVRLKRDRLRFQLTEAREALADFQGDHRKLWAEHFGRRYSLASPPREIVAHIAHRRDAAFDDGLDMLITGYFAAKRLADAYRSVVPDAKEIRVLDFGCGCGRVTRFLDMLVPDGKVELHGCDIDKEAIDWCNENIAETGTFFVSGDRPPLPEESGEFDVITVLSVFTHLPEDMQFEWLRELRKRLRPGGLMLATVHGPSFHRFIPATLREEFRAKGFAYADLGKTPDLPDYYLSTFHTHGYVQERWAAEGFEIVRILEQAVPQATVRQDLVVLRKV